MKLEVNLTHNPYDIIIEKGALKTVGQWVKSLWEPQKIALITDNHVGGLYAERVKLSLEHEGFYVVVFEYPSITLSFLTDRFEISFQIMSTLSSELNENLDKGTIFPLKTISI